MEISREKENGIVRGVIWKQVLKFFFPILLGTFFQQLYNTVDALVVSRMVEDSSVALAAVGGSSTQIINLLVGFFSGISGGAMVIVSQYFGAKRENDVRCAVHTALFFAVLLGLIITVLGLAFSPQMLRLMNTPEDTLKDSQSYLNIIFLSMIPAMVYNIGSGILRAVGDSRRPLYVLIVCCLLNVILDILMVAVLRWNVAGAAIATSISQTVSAVILLVMLLRSKECYGLRWKMLRLNRQMLLETVKIGLPSGFQSIMYAISNVILTAAVNGFETDAVAAWVAVGKVDSLHWMIMNAFGICAMTFVGQNYGARKPLRVKKSIRTIMLMSYAAGMLFGAVLTPLARPVMSIFCVKEEALRFGVEMLLIFAPTYFIYVPIEILTGSLRGMGDTLVPTIITLVGICGFRIAWVKWVLPAWHTIAAICVSYPASWIFTIIPFVVYYLWFRRRKLEETL